MADLIKAKVARGKTVTTEDGDFRSGQEISLTPEDHAFMKKNGFIVVEGSVELPVGNGPEFKTTEGPSVKVVPDKKSK